MKIVLLLSIIAALVASANLVSASEDSLRSRSSSVIDKATPTADDLDGLEDTMVTMLRGAIENEDPEKLFGSELWDGLKDKLCFEIEKKQGEEEKALAAGKFLLLFKLRKLLCNDDDGITTSTTSTTNDGITTSTTSTTTDGSITSTTSTTTGGETCVNPNPCIPTEIDNCCPGRFVFVLFAED